MKNSVILFFTIFFLCTIYTLCQKNIKLNKELSISKTNEKAFLSENSTLKDNNKAFQFTIDQLNYFNDSLLQKMNEVRESLNIKDKDVKQIQYITSEIVKSDTVIFRDTLFRDTLFKERKVSIDTIIGNKWYQTKIELRYPNTIITIPKFISEKYIVVNYKKETINPPKKWWILRLFQKKHKVVEVHVVEKNPYITTKEQRFIEIIK